MIAIVNYGMGNLRSVSNALDRIGTRSFICNHPEQLKDCDRIILPGVGAFGDAMHRLREGNWIAPLTHEVMKKKKPFLGICLGLQLLAETGEEHGTHQGLGWIRGTVQKIPEEKVDLRIPHIGWNDVVFRNSGSGLNSGLEEEECFYFVHSFVFQPEDETVIKGTCRYGTRFTACIEHKNIWAAQFHPEKSQKSGLKILGNFVDLEGGSN